MKEAVSCGGVVIYRGKVLLLYKNYKDKYKGWVFPKGTVELNEKYEETALREVKEETGATGHIMGYLGASEYEFNTVNDVVSKKVHWYLMMGEGYYSKPQKEEFFTDSGFYKYHEAYYLLKYENERHILELAYNEYNALKRSGKWINEDQEYKKK